MQEFSVSEALANEIRLIETEEGTNSPFGKLDYRQSETDKNLYWARFPEPPPLFIDNVLDYALGRVFDLEGFRIQSRGLNKEIILIALMPQTNELIAEIPTRTRAEKIAWQQWEKRYINNEPIFRTSNWIADGSRQIQEVETVLFNLDAETVKPIPSRVKVRQTGRLSDVATALLHALLTRQVEGEKIIQGLMRNKIGRAHV